MKQLFTKQYLAWNNIQIYAGDQQILLPATTNYDRPESSLPYFFTGTEEAQLPPNIRRITNIKELELAGFGVIAYMQRDKFKNGQKKTYDLARSFEQRSNVFCVFLKQMPPLHYVELDQANNLIRLVGPNINSNGSTDWIPLQINKPNSERDNSLEYIFKNTTKILKDYETRITGIIHKEKVVIEDLPFMITNDNKIACLPKPKSIYDRIEPRALVIGGSGMGKSILLHGVFCDRARLYWKKNIAVLNDVQSENLSWCKPIDDMGQSFKLPYMLKKINETGQANPAVYLTPNSNDLHEYAYMREGIGYKLALPFNEIIVNSHKYFDLQGSSKYMSTKSDELLKCNNPEELVNIFATGDKDLSYEKYIQLLKLKQIEIRETPPPNSIQFIRAIFNDLYQKKIIDRWCDVNTNWRVVKDKAEIGTFNPIIASLVAGLVPILETGELINKGYFPQYFNYFARDLFEKQNTEYFISNDFSVILIIDEVTVIAKRGKITPASEVLDNLLSRGRKRRIGTIISTQYYESLPDNYIVLCDHLFCFNPGDMADKIVHNWGIPNKYLVAEQLKKLRRYEFMAYTKDNFILYDFDGNTSITQGPLFGTVLPPLSIHAAPTQQQKS